MNLGLNGRAALILAGTRGIGLATARGLHHEGARISICGRQRAGVDAVCAELPGAVGICADVRNPEDIDQVLAKTRETVGDPEILVINAGGPPAGAFEELDDEAWRSAFDLTFMSAIRATRGVLPVMRARKWGRIIVVSSFGVKQPVPGLTLSNAVRMAVLGWAKTLSRQVAGDNILVNTVCPGWTRTDRVSGLLENDKQAEASIMAAIPLHRMAEPSEVANLIVFLASEAASYITGSSIAVDGGLVEGY